jgi:hypothetical protein
MLVAGTRLGPYEVVAPLGAGGMGEVYRARDARLGRDVAIKVLPDALATDAERLARFEREAKLLASMSHAGIGAIYGLEDAGGRPALVMEVVEGPTLAERLERGPLPEDEALAIARQLAEALEYAHDRGIVHRDLKPANVKLRPDGVVKVLDFGLARALDTGSPRESGDLTQSPTITNRMTAAGVILGTAAYMAPEQARGREADRRADIWAFGAVLFEMLTGRRAFAGETVSDTLAAVMRDEPDWAALPAALPPRWRRLIARCLVKDPRARLQAIGEARIALGEPASDVQGLPAAGGAAAPERGVRPAWFLALAALALALAAVAGWALLRRPAPAPAATELSMMLPPGHRFAGDRGYCFFALSPDGRAIAYVAWSGSGPSRMRVRRLDRREDVELPGTEGARNMFFSPDGEWIGFFNSQSMCKVSVRGGSPVVLAEAGQDRGGAWLDDGTIVYSYDVTVPLMRMPEAGGPAVAVTTLDTTRRERTHRFPCALAGGPWVVFTVGRTDSPGGYDDSPIDAVNVKTGERRNLVRGARRAIWAEPGWLLFDRSGDLYAMRLDPRDPRPGPEPLPVLDGVAGEASSGAGFFEVSNDGTLAWMREERGGDQREIGWIDRAGRWTPTKLPTGPYLSVRLSPDGSRALVSAGAGGGSSDLWVGDLASGAMNRLTYGSLSAQAVWSADGQRMVFPLGDSLGGNSIVVRRLDGAGEPRVLFRAPWPMVVTGLTPDGGAVLFCDYGRAAGRIRVARVAGGPDVRELPGDPGNVRNEQAGVVSPDGRWLAYVSNRTRREEVYVRSFDGTGGRWQVSTGGGGGVRWGRDSRELFFVEQGGERLVRVPLEARGAELVVGQPEPLFESTFTPTEPTFRDYDYDRLHDRFLFTRPPVGVNERRELALSLGWTSRLAATLRQRKDAR